MDEKHDLTKEDVSKQVDDLKQVVEDMKKDVAAYRGMANFWKSVTEFLSAHWFKIATLILAGLAAGGGWKDTLKSILVTLTGGQ